MAGLFYYSSQSGNTVRFIDKLGLPAERVPIGLDADQPTPRQPYVLICPTYADGAGRGAVPKQVIRFLNDPARRALLRGVIATGNRNFGAAYALSGEVISRKCDVPVLYRFELAGIETDFIRVRAGLEKFWGSQCLTRA